MAVYVHCNLRVGVCESGLPLVALKSVQVHSGILKAWQGLKGKGGGGILAHERHPRFPEVALHPLTPATQAE